MDFSSPFHRSVSAEWERARVARGEFQRLEFGLMI
jgi:hypothetical protein